MMTNPRNGDSAGVPHKKPSGYWNEFSNVARDLQHFVEAHGSIGTMPTNTMLVKANRSDLASAIGKHGGYALVAERLNLKVAYTKKPSKYWDDFSNVEKALSDFVEENGTHSQMPTKEELCKAGLSGLARAIQKYGGIRLVAERLKLKLKYSAKPKRYWKDFGNLERELLNFIDQNGRSGVMPSQVGLTRLGRTDLANAIRRHGGHQLVAERLSLKPARTSRPKPYLSDFQNLEREVRGYVERHGTSGEMPTNPQLRRDRRFDLAKAIGSFGGFQAVAARLGLHSKSKQIGYWNDLSNIGREIAAFNNEHGLNGSMPTPKQLKQGRSSLAVAIIKFGGFHLVANQLNLKMSHPPRRIGYYKDVSNFERELIAFIESKGRSGFMPTYGEFRKAKRSDLARAVHEFGGSQKVAHQFGLKLKSTAKPRGYWKDFGNVEAELSDYIQTFGKTSAMPLSTELEEAGQSSLVQAITNIHGGFEAVAKRLQLTYESRRHGYWADVANIENEVRGLAQRLGTPDVMPTQEQLGALGGGIKRAIIKNHGGLRALAKKLGLRLSYKRKPKGHWNDFQNFEQELRTYIEKFGKCGTMPTQGELASANRSDLLHAITRHYGGMQAVAEILNLELSHNIKPQGYWEDEPSFRRELFEYIEKHGKEGLMPTAAKLARDGRNDLVNAMRHQGGIPDVAQRYGLKLGYTKKPLGYWNDFSNVERDLLIYIRKFGKAGSMPTHKELMETGFTDLANAISKSGGSGEVARRLKLLYTPVRIDPATAATVEKIARAIEPLAESNLLSGAQTMVILRRAGLLEFRNRRIVKLNASLARGDRNEIESAIAQLDNSEPADTEATAIEETEILAVEELEKLTTKDLDSANHLPLVESLLISKEPDAQREQAVIRGLSSLGELRLPLDEVLSLLTSKILWDAFYRRLYAWYGSLDAVQNVGGEDVESAILSAYPEHIDNEFVAEASALFTAEVEQAVNFVVSLRNHGWDGPRLRLHQADAARRMAEVLKGTSPKRSFLLNADDPGMGKSAAFLAAACASGVGNVIIVAPKTVADDTWVAAHGEIRRCLPHARIVRGLDEALIASQSSALTFVVLHYEELLNENLVVALAKQSFDCLCLDEIHFIKQRAGQESTARRAALETLRTSAETAIGLTGTPLVNELAEPMSLLQTLSQHEPQFDHARLSNRSMRDIADVFEALLPHVIRRRKREVLLHLPGCYVQAIDIPLPEDLDKGMLNVYAWPKSQAAQALVELRKLATDAKLPYLLRRSQTARKLLILTYLTDDVSQKIFAYLEDFLPNQIAHINGQTRKAERQKLLDSFRTPDGVRVLVGTTGTIGTGLTLFDPVSEETANEIIVADLPYTWAEFEQGIARLYREGQQQCVRVAVLQTTTTATLCDGSGLHTLDERIWALIEGKRELSDVAIDGKYDTTDSAAKVQKALRRWLKLAREIGVEPLAVERRSTERSEAQKWRGEIGRLRSVSASMADEIFADPEYTREFLAHLKTSTAGNLSHQWLRAKLTLLLRPDLTVVDMGCGLNPFADLPCRVIGLDRHDLPEQLRGKMEKPPLPDDSADVLVYSLSLYGTASDLLAYFKHAVRILRGGGHLFVVEPASSFTDEGLLRFLKGLHQFGLEVVGTVKNIRGEDGTLLMAMHLTLTGEMGEPKEAEFERK